MSNIVEKKTPDDGAFDQPFMKSNGEISGKLPRKMAKTTRTRYDGDHWLTEVDYEYRCDQLENKALGLWPLNRKELHDDVQEHFLNFSYRGSGFFAVEVKDAPIISYDVEVVDDEPPVEKALTFPEKTALLRFSSVEIKSMNDLSWSNPVINYIAFFGILAGPIARFSLPLTLVYVFLLMSFLIVTLVGRHKLEKRFADGNMIESHSKNTPRREKVLQPIPAGREVFIITEALGLKLKDVLQDLPDDYNLHFLIGYKLETDDRISEISKWLGIVGKLYEEDRHFPVDCVPLLSNDVKITLEKLIEAKALNSQFEREIMESKTGAMKELSIGESAATLERSLAYLENYAGGSNND